MKSGASESSYGFLEKNYKFPENVIVSHLPQELQQSNKPIKVLWTQHSYDQPHYLNFDFSICDLIVSPSNWCREQFIKYHHIAENKIITIPTGVSNKFTYSSNKSKTFIYTSIPYKGLEVLAKIIPHIPEATFKIFSAMNLYDIQDDPYTELYEYLKSLPNVIYSPAVDQEELIEHLQDAAFFIHPNIWEETFCVSLAEAMSCGCYPILTDIGALPEVSNELATIVPMEGERTSTGYKVTDNFIYTFISACKQAIYFFDNERKYYNEVSQSTSQFASKIYDWKIISKQWENAMNSLLNTPTEQVYFRPQTLDGWIYDEVYTQNIYEVENFNDDDIVVDIGSHSGYFAKLCMDRGCKQIHCFEPEEDNFQQLLKNLSTYFHYQAYQLAVYKEMGTVDFCVVPGKNTGLHSVYDRGGIISKSNSVSLDNILSNLPKVSLLKIDTEGSEFEILMNSKLLHKVDKIVGEYHNDLTDYTIDHLISFLEKNNFDVYKIKETNSTSGTFFALHK